MSTAPWVRLLALGARERSLDEAVRASSFAELWASSRAEVLLDLAHLAGLELDEVLVAAESILDAPGHAGARRWAAAGRDALRAGETFAASYAFGRVLDALEVLADPQLAVRARKALELDAVAAALALGGTARVAA